jgi:exonuclease III
MMRLSRLLLLPLLIVLTDGFLPLSPSFLRAATYISYQDGLANMPAVVGPPAPRLQFTHPIRHGEDLLHRTGGQQPKPSRPPGLNICTYNIQDGHGNGESTGLTTAVFALEKAGVDIAILTETKLVDNTYSKDCHGYDIECTPAVSRHQGGIALVSRRTDSWCLEATRHHGHNVLSTVVVCGDHRIPLIGAYLPPSSLNSLPELIAALDRFAGRDPILLGDLNVNLEDSTSTRNRDVATVLASYGLLDMLPHFRQRKPFRHNCTWWKQVNDVIL